MATVLVVGVKADCLAEPRPRERRSRRVGSRTRTDFRERPRRDADTKRKPETTTTLQTTTSNLLGSVGGGGG
jgi:hypothetical protein